MDNCGITTDRGKIIERSERAVIPIIDIQSIPVPGGHSIINAMAAAACTRALNVDVQSIAKGLEVFKGLPHRLEYVGECKGVKFYNDSKATTPEAAIAGVMAFDTPVIPIFGGYDKGVAFDEMAHQIAGRVTGAALIGVTAPKIARALTEAGVESTIYDSLEKAFGACVSRARKGQTILLSPACASYDMFNDYEERGSVRSLVNDYRDLCS